MPDTSEFSEAKRALLEKYLKGNLQQVSTTRVTHTPHTTPENSNSRARVVQVKNSLFSSYMVVGRELLSFASPWRMNWIRIDHSMHSKHIGLMAYLFHPQSR